MHTLYRKLNYRNLRLDADSIGESVGVYRRDGRKTELRWLGFITRGEAKAKLHSKSVRLDIVRVDGIDLEPGCFVQGCCTAQGVYAVIDSEISIVRKIQH